ncbi:MAG: hypothetical protein JNJ45_05780 [Chthonomonas sp.]|nr:hypothetical protein [Chthonomonas sp.]
MAIAVSAMIVAQQHSPKGKNYEKLAESAAISKQMGRLRVRGEFQLAYELIDRSEAIKSRLWQDSQNWSVLFELDRKAESFTWYNIYEQRLTGKLYPASQIRHELEGTVMAAICANHTSVDFSDFRDWHPDADVLQQVGWLADQAIAGFYLRRAEILVRIHEQMRTDLRLPVSKRPAELAARKELRRKILLGEAEVPRGSW